MNRLLKNKEKKEVVFVPKKNIPKKDKYEKAFEQIIYFMLNNDWIITQVEKERLIFPTEVMRSMCSEIIYYYKKNGSINIADFLTYLNGKESLVSFLNNILSCDYLETTDKDELFRYFKVVREYSTNEEIKRLMGLMKKEIDPIEQAKIVERIRKLKLGE